MLQLSDLSAFFATPPRRAVAALCAARPSSALPTLLIGACAVSADPAHAGRPLATDDAAVVAAGACQIETWFERTSDGYATWLNPACNPFASTELALGGARIHEDDAPSFTVQTWQIKQLLRGYTAEQIGFAAALGGEPVRHGDDDKVFFNGIATVPLAGEARVLNLNLGALHEREGGRDRTRALWGLAVDAEIAPATHASLEAFGTSGERASWQFGLRHELVPGHIQIDASVGSVFGRWNDTHNLTLGLVLVSPAFLR